MKVRRPMRRLAPRCSSPHRPADGFLCLVLVGFLIQLLTFVGVSPANSAGPVRKPPAASSAEQPPQSYAPIGDSGYRVPIREFNMKRIIGDRPEHRVPPPPPDETGTRPSAAGEVQQSPQPDERVPEMEPTIRRLPFDPEMREPGPKPPQEQPPPVEEAPPEKEEDVPPIRPPQAPEEPLEARPPTTDKLPPGQVPASPVILGASRVRGHLKALSVEPAELPEPSDTLEGISLDVRREPAIIEPPLAAEPPLELASKPAPEPEPAVMPTPEPLPEPTPAPKPMAPPKAEPVPQPEPEPAPKPEPVPEPAPKPAPVPLPAPQPTPVPKPEPVPEPAPAPKPTAPPKAEPVPPTVPEPSPERVSPPGTPSKEVSPPPTEHKGEPASVPQESLPPREPPPAPPREALPSPLDKEARHSRETRDYLKETAPLIEELSLLMTRAPSLDVEDYDPSSDTPMALSPSLVAKLEHMKRDLQILDSKTFAIMPPKRYEEYHAVIRESITETYQACDAILSYLREPTAGNLKKVREHLRKARDLIQRTQVGKSYG